MSDQTQTLTYERIITAPPAQLFRAFTNASALREWLCDASTTSPKMGGHLFLKWDSGYYATGEFTDLQADRAVSFTWHGRHEPTSTHVAVKLEDRDGCTHLTLTHSGISDEANWETAVQEFDQGWKSALDNLASVYETGEDLRFVRRPMLGITISDFNVDIAAQLGTPVTEGIRLDSIVAGLGAETAGLRQNDVIVGIAGKDVTDWPSLNKALGAHYAGDTVEVIFYRAAEKHAANMTLSRRPLPEIPATAGALAEIARARYAQAEAELEQFLVEVTEAEASYRTAPDEWNVKEVLAHLIQGERGWQQGMEYLIGSQEPLHDDWAGNLLERVRATVAAFPTVRELLDELKRLNAETLALVAALPDSFVARKGSYWRLAYNMLEAPYHHQTHMEQMRTAVAQARQ